MGKKKLLTLMAVTAIFLSGCLRSPIEELSRQELFSLGIGKMDNQLDLFQVDGEIFNRKNRIYMRDGLFYLTNGNSAKIMEFSSYGDLIFLLYNMDRNPEPVSFNFAGTEGSAVTREAVSYPLENIGELVVDNEKRIYVEDVVSEERQVKDKVLGVILDKVILRFDRHLKFQDFIGQEGVGGTPFPYIHSIHITDMNELVVICRTPQAWLIFWYSGSGSLLYQVEIDQNHLPTPEKRKGGIPYIAQIYPDLNLPVLHLMLYYYQDRIDESTQLQSSDKNLSSRIYGLDLKTGKYTGYIHIPHGRFRKEQVRTRLVEVPTPSFELLGVDSGGHFFLLRREEANLFQLLILDADGKIAGRRYLVMEDSELFFKEVRLSSSGIIYALLCEEYSAKIVWWRSDRLLREDKG